MMLAFFAGCGGGSSDDSEATEAPAQTNNDEVQATEAPAEEEEPEAEPEDTGISYPISDGEVLTMFMLFSDQLLNYYDSNDDTVFWPELEARTGVHIDFAITPNNASLAEQFNIMVAGGDYTDLVNSVHMFYTSGLDTAVDQGVLLPLNDYIDDCMPDYKAVLESNEDMYKAAVTDEGYYAVARGFYDTVFSTVYGPVIRQDWLDKVGMDVPVTYDDLYEVMKAFKTECGAEYGISIPYTGVPFGDYLVSGFGVSGFTLYARNLAPFYQENGTVKYGPIEEGFREYLTTMNKWYSEGLIDQDFFAYTANFTYPEDSEISGEKVGIWYTQASLMGNYAANFFDEDSSFELTVMKDTVQNEGDINHLYYAQDLGSGQCVGVTTACENPELAAKWLNYAYTDEGNILFNYGVEGTSFEYVDGQPTLSDVVVANADFPMSYAIGYYAQSNGAFIIDSQRLSVGYQGAAQEAMSTWASSTDGANSYPYYATMTADEGTDFNLKYSDIDTYVSTSILQFIIGERSMDEFDDFVAQVESMGIDDCIAIKQAAYDRYNAR
jgi:putative aldouronate transport system substrate-binding protein